PIHLSIEAFVVVDIRNECRLSLLEYPACDSFISGEAHCFQALGSLGADVAGHGEKQLLPLLVEQEEGTTLGRKDLVGLGHDERKQVLQLHQGAESPAQLQEQGELLGTRNSCWHLVPTCPRLLFSLNEMEENAACTFGVYERHLRAARPWSPVFVD